ncbi:MAG: hypothetical protein H7X92_03480 [Chitinophagales bacterium]|nr:hypothetical protein [Hyphomicrobiales bacterium]
MAGDKSMDKKNDMEDGGAARERMKDDLEERLDRWRPLSWSAIFFGVLAACAITVALHILGVGVTASVVDTQDTARDGLMTLGGVSGVWFLASSAIGLFVGGFVASAMSHTFSGKRAAIYGLGVWALTTLITVSIVAPAMMRGATSAVNTAGTVVDRTATALSGATNAAAQAGQANPGLFERVQRTLIGTTQGEVDQGAVQEITNLVGQRIVQGEWTQAQREQLNNAVARVGKIPVEDARRRVDEAQTTVNNALRQTEDSLRSAAETARVAIAATAFWAFASLLIGLLAAYLGARSGEMDEEDLPTFARIGYAPAMGGRRM